MAKNDTILTFGAVDKVTPVLRGIEAQVGRVAGSFRGFSQAAGVLAGALSARAIVNFGKSLIDAGDQANTIAKRLNIAASSFSALGYAVKQSGSDVDTLKTGLTFLTRQLADAASGGKAAKLFEDLGVAVRDSGGQIRKVDEVLKDLATRFANSEDGAGELAAATKLLGRSAGPELLQFLNIGAGGIEQLEEKARSLGFVISDEFARDADAFNDKLEDLGGIARGIGRDFVQELLPALSGLSDALVKNREEFGEATPMARGFAEVIKLVGTAAVATSGAIEALVINFSYLKEKSKDADAVTEGLLRFNKGFAFFATGNFKAALDTLGEGFRDMAKDTTAAGDALNTSLTDAATRTNRALDGLNGTVTQHDKNWGLFVGSGKPKEAGKQIEGAGVSAGKAAPKIKALGIEVQKLVDPTEEINDLLSDMAAEMGGPLVEAAIKYRDELVKIAELQAALLAQGPPTAEAAGQFEALTRAAQQAGDGYRAEIAGMEAANDDFVDNTGEAALEVQQAWENMTYALTDVFEDFIHGALNSWDDFGRSLQRVADAYLRNISNSFRNTVLTPGGGGLQAFGTSINQQSMYGAGGTGTTAAGWAGALGSAYGGYQAAEQGSLGGSVVQFAAAGAQIGGVYGAIIGAVVGAIAYALAKPDIPALNLIGDDVVGTSGFQNLAPGSNFESRLGGFTFASIDEVDRETRDQLGAAVVSFDNAIAAIVDSDQLGRIKDALADWNLNLEGEAITAENILESRFDAILATFSQDIQDFVNLGVDFEDRFSRLGQKLEFPKLLAEIMEGLAEADTVAGLSETERQIRQINSDFDELASTAAILGATEEELAQIEEYRVNALNRVADATERANAAALSSLTDDIVFEDSIAGLSDYQQELARVNRYYDDLRDRAIELGASEEVLGAIERRRIRETNELTAAQEANADAIGGLTDIYDAMTGQADLARDRLDALREAASGIAAFLDNLAFSQTSILSPADRFNAAQEQFRALAARAAQGDIGAIGGLTGAAQNLLNEGRGFFGATDQFASLERFVRDALTPFGQLDQANNLPDAINSLRTVLELLNRTLSGGIVVNQGSNVVYLNEVRATTAAVKNMTTTLSSDIRALRGNSPRVG